MAIIGIIQVSELRKARRWEPETFLGVPEEQLLAEIAKHETTIKRYQTRIETLRKQIESNRELQRRNRVMRITIGSPDETAAATPTPE